MSTAKIIQQQLMANTPMVVFSWGAHAYKAVSESQLVDDFNAHRGALLFKVQARHFNGHVAVVLMPDDTYTVRFGRLVKGRFLTKSAHDGIYCDMLQDFIDGKIETKVKE